MKIESSLILGGRYRLLSRIAVGGMGEVWRARDTHLNIIVAVKILRDELVGSEQFLARLRVEAENAKKVTHPNLARVLDHDETNGRGWIVMEFVQGEPLSKRLKSGSTIRVRELLPLLIQISKALFALHSVGVVHRDVKPANILVTDDGVAKLTDFGISKSDSGPNMTAVGMVMGTAQYLAPEQVLGETASARGDIYALGIIAYESMVGNRPFTGKTQVDIAFAHVNESLPPLPAYVPAPLASVIEKMLAKSPDDRFENADLLAKQLHKVLLQVCPDVSVPVGQIATFERPLTRRETRSVPKLSADQNLALQQVDAEDGLKPDVDSLQPNTGESVLVDEEIPPSFSPNFDENIVSKPRRKIYRRGGAKVVASNNIVDSKPENNSILNSFSGSKEKIRNVKQYFSSDKFAEKSFDEILFGNAGEENSAKKFSLLLLSISVALIVSLFVVFVYLVFSNVSSLSTLNFGYFDESFSDNTAMQIFSKRTGFDLEMLFTYEFSPMGVQ